MAVISPVRIRACAFCFAAIQQQHARSHAKHPHTKRTTHPRITQTQRCLRTHFDPRTMPVNETTMKPMQACSQSFCSKDQRATTAVQATGSTQSATPAIGFHSRSHAASPTGTRRYTSKLGYLKVQSSDDSIRWRSSEILEHEPVAHSIGVREKCWGAE